MDLPCSLITIGREGGRGGLEPCTALFGGTLDDGTSEQVLDGTLLILCRLAEI